MTANTTPTTVMLVDDHAVVRAGLTRLIEQQHDIDIVASYSSGEEAYRNYSPKVADVLVMDLSMPGMGGMEAARKILEHYPKAKIIIFSMHENPTFASQLIKIGVKGYVTKTGEDSDLIKAIHTVAKNKTYLNSQVAQKIAIESMGGDENPMKLLSAREFEVFRLTAEGLPQEEVGDRLNISHKTVANYISMIKQKLGINSPVEIVRLALRFDIIQN